ncbi:hypothetical protein BurJ1DRAFT_2339 [Burkholderiales bacterium JOSHI_001]|nr:hypothetical protein BurJ1DRAFT_2339 [Burkholderiales bacterium JOSHI_001]
MAITFDEVSVEVAEPRRDSTPAPAAAACSASAAAPELLEQVELALRLRTERQQRLCTD